MSAGILSSILLVLIIHGLIGCHPIAQFYQNPQQNQFGGPFGRANGGPNNGFGRFNGGGVNSSPRGSVSAAKSEAYNRDIDIGDFASLSNTISNSKTITKSNGGFQNGGSTNAAKSMSVTNQLNIGNLDISRTGTLTKSISNGQVSRGVAQDIRVGDVEFGSSLSRDNLKNGFGLQRGDNGGLELNLGFLNLDLSRNANRNDNQAQSNAMVSAVGKGAQTNAQSKTNTENKKFGLFDVTSSHTQSKAVGSVRRGQTSGNAGSQTENDESNVQSFGSSRPRFFGRQKRNANNYFEHGLRQRRQFYNQYNNGPPRFAQQFPSRQNFGFPQQQNSNAQGVANNNNRFFDQSSGANTNSQNIQNEFGNFRQNTGSSIGSNLAKDGTGQLSAANTAQQSYETADGSGDKNSAQSQSANLGEGSQDLSSANADTLRETTADSDKIQANSGSNSNSQNEFGTSSNTAQVNTAVVKEGDTESSLSNSNSQSIFQGNNGDINAANSGAKSETIMGPNGLIINSSSSQASSFSNGQSPGGSSAQTSSSASSGSGNGQAFGNANSNTATNNFPINQGFGQNWNRFPQGNRRG